jgi:nitroimidazol reductase NimA-like FMN-containing flavoprotein (pyridoxamine 5'-phosphate oxidase superfamily)
MPVWGVWIEDVLYFDGSLETRRAKNLLANPAVSVHLESATQVVIMEGEAREVPKPGAGLVQSLLDKYREKYRADGYEPKPDTWDNGGLFAVKPKTVLAWTKFPHDTTRFRF